MSFMIDQPLLTDGTWTEVVSAPVANLLLVGPPNGWAIFVGPDAPGDDEPGLVVSSSDGSFAGSGFSVSDVVYARPFGRLAGGAMSLRGMAN